jgi:hypothetical protein
VPGQGLSPSTIAGEEDELLSQEARTVSEAAAGFGHSDVESNH